MAILNVNTDKGFNMPALLSKIMVDGIELVKTDKRGRVEVTYTFEDHRQELLDIVITGDFDRSGKTGPVDQIEIFKNGKSLAEVKGLDIDLRSISDPSFLEHPVSKYFLLILGVTKNLDTINGGRGDDILYAMGGELYGAKGDDIFFSLGKTHYDGGSDTDWVSYFGDENFKIKGNGITVSLIDPLINTGEAKGDTYNSIEGVVGSKGSDIIYGSGAANILQGEDGNDVLHGGRRGDTLIGGEGMDLASYEAASSTTGLGVVASLKDPTSNRGDAKGDSYESVEGLLGSALRDTLVGDDRANVIQGGSGDDLIDGGRGADELWGDSEEFGFEGSDTFVLNGASHGLKTIMDFDVFDIIKIDRAGFGLGSNYQLVDGSTYVVEDGAAATTELSTFLFDTKTDRLFFDGDGSGSGDAVLLAKLKFHSQEYLDINDFVVV